MKTKLLSLISMLHLFALSFQNAALAGEPVDGGILMQPPASTSAVEITNFHNFMLWIIAGIVAFVSILLLIVFAKYNRHANKEPSTTTHHVMLEVLWTLVPVVILVIIAVPSFRLLYYTDHIVEPEMTLKVTGYSWYWGYEYPDHDGISFSAYMIPEDEIDTSKGQRRLLSTDNPVVLPIDTNIQILVQSAPTDVIHSWAVPALGLKKDAVPGRLNETWVRITKPGTYFGQCSELCGKNHAYMPIEIKAVSKEDFEKWLVGAKEEFAAYEQQPQLYSKPVELAHFNTQK